MSKEKTHEVNFSFSVTEKNAGAYGSDKVLGIYVANEVVPRDQNPVHYLKERVQAEFLRVTGHKLELERREEPDMGQGPREGTP